MQASCERMDQEMSYLLARITSHPVYTGQLSKHTRIRVNSWLSKLQCIVSNNLWRRNRNAYLRLLCIMVQFQEIIEPFTAMPPQEVPTLQKHLINCILLKLDTRAKDKDRDPENKENREAKSGRSLPSTLWSLLESKHMRNQSSEATFKTLPNLDTTCQKNSKFESINIDYLSPISQVALHARNNSNLSACTYSSVDKFKEALVSVEQALDFAKNPIPDLNDKASEQVKYFKKNRNQFNTYEISQRGEMPAMSSQLYKKVYSFLGRHSRQLQQDEEFGSVMDDLRLALRVSIEKSQAPNQRSLSDLYTAQEQQQTPNSYDYAEGEYSQYSEIEFEEGIPQSKVHTIADNMQQSLHQAKKLLWGLPVSQGGSRGTAR